MRAKKVSIEQMQPSQTVVVADANQGFCGVPPPGSGMLLWQQAVAMAGSPASLLAHMRADHLAGEAGVRACTHLEAVPWSEVLQRRCRIVLTGSITAIDLLTQTHRIELALQNNVPACCCCQLRPPRHTLPCRSAA